VENARALGFERTAPESMGPGRYFDVLPGNHLYAGWLGTANPNRDAAHFLGFSAILLGGLGAVRGRFVTQARLGRGLFVAWVAAGFLLSLGPEVQLGERTVPAPYAILFHWVPGFQSVRYPERFSILVVLGLGPLLAAGLVAARHALRIVSAWPHAAALFGLVLFAEHLSAPLRLEPLAPGHALPSVYRWLATEPSARVVAEVPATRHLLERLDGFPMYHSTVHWKSTVQGFTGYFPPAYTFIRWRLFHFPSAETLRFLERLGVDTVVLRPGAEAPEGADLDAQRRLVGPFAEGHRVLQLDRARGATYPRPARETGDLVEVDRRAWNIRASHPSARLAVDGDPKTYWTTPGPNGRGDFYWIGFGRPVRLARLTMTVPDPFCFPTRIRLIGEDEAAATADLEFDEPRAYDTLFSLLFYEPRSARLDLDLKEPKTVAGVRVRIRETDAFEMPWLLGEIRAYERRVPAPVSGS
jgi:hypothetical protein